MPSQPPISLKPKPSQLLISLNSFSQLRSLNSHQSSTHQPSQPPITSVSRCPSRPSLSIHSLNSSLSTPTEARPTSHPKRQSPQTHAIPTDPLQVSCLCHFVVDACDFWFGYNIKEWIYDQRMWDFWFGITSKNVFNDFFFLFFQFIILDAIIFLLFLLNEKFYHLISEHPFRFDSKLPWMDRMYLYWNVLRILCLQEFVVWFSCNGSSCGLCNLCREVYIFCCLCNLLCCTKP